MRPRSPALQHIVSTDPIALHYCSGTPEKRYGFSMNAPPDSLPPDDEATLLAYLRDLGSLTLDANREWGRTMEPDGDGFLVRVTDTMALGAETERYTLTEGEALAELLRHVKSRAANDFPVPTVIESHADVVRYFEQTGAFSWLREHLRQRAFQAQVHAARTKSKP